MAFHIVHVVPMKKTVMGEKGPEEIELDPYRVERCEVVVNFNDVLETRHAFMTTDGWSIRNSSAAINARRMAAEWVGSAETAVVALQAAIKPIEAKIAEMGRKKGVKALRDALKFAKAQLAQTAAALEAARTNQEKVFKANPEFVTFPRLNVRPQDAAK